jgi:hypothetical protein
VRRATAFFSNGVAQNVNAMDTCMSINVPIFTCNNLVLDCFRGAPDSEDESNEENRSMTDELCVLPVDPAHVTIRNLYPMHNHVQSWNTFIVGTDMTYVLANITSLPPSVVLPSEEISKKRDVSKVLLNHRAGGKLNRRFSEFLQPIWNSALDGSATQVFAMIRNVTYLVNAYPLRAADDHIVGGVMFLRPYYPDMAQSNDTKKVE